MQCFPLRLEATGLPTLDLASPAFKAAELDLGFPLVRTVSASAPDTDGEIDTTELSGARVVTLGLSVSPTAAGVSRWALTQQVKAYLNPRLRPRLYVTFPDAPELMLTLRGANLGDRWVPQRGARFDITAQWVCPSGLIESAELHTATILPGAGGVDGIEFGPTVEFGTTVEFPFIEPPGTVQIENAGDRDAFPVVRAFGPFGIEGSAADETEIGNVTTGKTLVLAGLGISVGDYLEIDFRRKTILVNSLADQSRYQYLTFPDSAWWTLAPGVNEVSFRPNTFSGNANAVVYWRDAYS